MTKILLIEDDNWLAETMRSALSQFDVLEAASGQAALEVVDEHEIDLIVADIMLPGTNVIDVLHDLQSYSDSRVIPVILCSTLTKDLLLEDLMAYGVVSMIDKAEMSPEMLRSAVQKAVNENDTSGGHPD